MQLGPRKLVLASVFWTARLQCNRLWSLTNGHLSRAVFIFKLCLPQTQNRGKLLSICQLQFHLQEVEIATSTIRSSVRCRSSGVSQWLAQNLETGGFHQQELHLRLLSLTPGSAPTFLLSPGWGGKWLKNTQDESISSWALCGWHLSDSSCLWPVTGSAMWWETLYMCRVLSFTSQRRSSLTASILWSCPQDTHRPADLSGHCPLSFLPHGGLAGMQVPSAHPLPVRPSGAALTFTTAAILSKAATQHDCHWNGKLKARTWTPNKVEESVH